jgi:hypothetical protein
MPVNYLLIKAIQKYDGFYGDKIRIEFPLHSGRYISLKEVADILIKRNWSIFLKDGNNHRPVYGQYNWFYELPENQDLVLFHEYYHGDTSRGMGASHQTGWTALITAI